MEFNHLTVTFIRKYFLPVGRGLQRGSGTFARLTARELRTLLSALAGVFVSLNSVTREKGTINPDPQYRPHWGCRCSPGPRAL